MKDNKLLAEYLGYKYRNNYEGHDLAEVLINGEWEYFQPHKNWNQLMMVVEKIEKESGWIDVGITRNHCSIEKGDTTLVSVNWQIKTKIEAAYNACIEYVRLKND